MAELRAEQRRNRKTPMTPSQRARRPKKTPRRALGDHYSTRSYHHAIRYGCLKAGAPIWGPNRLRHNAGTRLRKEFGLDVARAVLGHSDADTTTIYAERDASLAAVAMERVG
jgi:integrase